MPMRVTQYVQCGAVGCGWVRFECSAVAGDKQSHVNFTYRRFNPALFHNLSNLLRVEVGETDRLALA